MKLTKEYQSLFALWILSKDFGKSSYTHYPKLYLLIVFAEIQLGDTDKPLKLMSTWKTFIAQYKRSKGSTPNKSRGQQDPDSPALYLRRNIFYPVEREKTVRIVHTDYYVLINDCHLQISDSTTLELLYADVSHN